MEFVPYEFCDSVVLLTNPSEVGEIEKPEGYWSKAARNPANHHNEIRLEVIPVKSDCWKCVLREWHTYGFIDNWEERIAANHCLVLNAVTVMPRYSCGTYKTLSTAELEKLLLYCYRRPYEWKLLGSGDIVTKMTDQQWTRTMNLFEDFDICRIELHYEPRCDQFLVRALGSQHLVGVHIGGKIPSSLHSHIQEWASRVEFDELVTDSPKLLFEFSVFEKLMRRIEGGHVRFLHLGRNPLQTCFSQADCEKIRSFLRTWELILDSYIIVIGERMEQWKKEKASVSLLKARARHYGVVTCCHQDAYSQRVDSNF